MLLMSKLVVPVVLKERVVVTFGVLKETKVAERRVALVP